MILRIKFQFSDTCPNLVASKLKEYILYRNTHAQNKSYLYILAKNPPYYGWFLGPPLALHTKGKWCSQMRPAQCYSQSQVVSACQIFRPVAPFFFWRKYHFWLFGYAYDVPLVKLILNISGFMGVTSTVKHESRIHR